MPNENTCTKGGDENGTTEYHSCPKAIVRGDDSKDYCNCCNKCYNECVDEANELIKEHA